MELELFQKKLSKSESSSSQGIGLRVIVEGRPGYSYTRKFTQESIDLMVNDAVSLAGFTDPLDIDMPQPTNITSTDLKKWSSELEKVTMNDMKSFCESIDDYCWQKDERVENINYLGMGKQSSWSAFFNSRACLYPSKSNSISAYVGVVSAEKDQKKSGMYSNGTRSMTDLDPILMANLAVERSLELLGASSFSSSSCPVILSNRVSGSLLGKFLSVFSADQVQKGQSKFAGKLGQQVGSSLINLHSLPHIEKAPGSRFVDSEGIATKDLAIMEEGVLNSFIYNLETSKKAGVEPSGHGSRGLQGKVGIGFANLHMSKGESKLNDLLASSEEVFYITKLEGGSACSSVSGEISIGVQGLLFRHGQIERAVDACTLSTNFFDLLNQIQALSDEYSDSFSSLKIPDILIDGVALSG
ncbi:MAG: TldD/PmbA family protein [Planctomycetes bacterium]|nr:TldD/PmbA family protein [Planctomycetota bacterium]